LCGCAGDLDQMPKDPQVLVPNEFVADPKGYIGGLLSKCYSGMAVSGQKGAGDSEISSPDAGMSCYNRAIFMANEFTTDEYAWIYSSDAGVADFVQTNWSAGNPVVDLVYSRLYTHIAVCNDFIRFLRNAGDYGVSLDGIDVKQFNLEARAPRAAETPAPPAALTADEQADVDYLNKHTKWKLAELKTDRYKALYRAIGNGEIDSMARNDYFMVEGRCTNKKANQLMDLVWASKGAYEQKSNEKRLREFKDKDEMDINKIIDRVAGVKPKEPNKEPRPVQKP